MVGADFDFLLSDLMAQRRFDEIEFVAVAERVIGSYFPVVFDDKYSIKIDAFGFRRIFAIIILMIHFNLILPVLGYEYKILVVVGYSLYWSIDAISIRHDVGGIAGAITIGALGTLASFAIHLAGVTGLVEFAP